HWEHVPVPFVDLITGPEDRLEDRCRDLTDAAGDRRDDLRSSRTAAEAESPLEARVDRRRPNGSVEPERLARSTVAAVELAHRELDVVSALRNAAGVGSLASADHLAQIGVEPGDQGIVNRYARCDGR